MHTSSTFHLYRSQKIKQNISRSLTQKNQGRALWAKGSFLVKFKKVEGDRSTWGSGSGRKKHGVIKVGQQEGTGMLGQRV